MSAPVCVPLRLARAGRTWSRTPRLVLLLLLVFTAALPAAGSAASLIVTVRDSGGVVPGATVVVREPGGTNHASVSGATGEAVFEGLSPGRYTVTASLSGFADATVSGVEVAAATPARVEVVLSMLQFSTTVTVTTANRREELLLDVPEPMALFDKAQIEDTGARTAKDLLVEQAGAGVQVNAGGGQGHVSINGIPNSGVLVLLDGRRYLGKDANGNLNLEEIDLAGVERVEVVKGAGSALYGSDALGGVVNIITRRATAPGLAGGASLSGGSYGDVRVTSQAGYRWQEGGLAMSGSARNYDGFDLSASNPQTIGQPASEFRTVYGNVDQRLSDRFAVRLLGDYSHRRITNYFFAGATQLGSVYDSRRGLTRYTVTPELEWTPRATTSVSVTGSFGRYDRRETQVFPSRVVPVAPWKESNRELRVTGRQTFGAFGREHFLQAGYEYRRERLDRASLRFPDGSPFARRTLDVAWLQQEFAVLPRVTVTGGFRFDRYSDFGDKWSPKVGAVYALSPAQRLRVSYGEGFRAPQFGELYLQTPTFVGNPALKPERSTSVTAGYAYAGPLAQVSLDLFRTKVEDGITFNLARFPFTYGNLRQYTARGLNAQLSAPLRYGFVPSVSYAFVERQDANGRTVGDLPRHAVFAKLGWTHHPLGVRVNVRTQYQSAITFSDGTSAPGYATSSLRAAKRVVFGGGTPVSVFAQVDNLFDKRDIFRRNAAGEPIPGEFQVWLAPRTFLAGVSVEFQWSR